MHCIGAQFCVCMFLDCKILSLNMLQNEWRFHLQKLPWIAPTYECNVIFVGTFVVSRIPQQANEASCFGIHNCKWIPQNVGGIRKYKRIPQTVSGFRILFKTELAL